MFLSLKRLYPPTNDDNDDTDVHTVASARSARSSRRFKLGSHFGGGNNDDDKSVRSTRTTGRLFTRGKAEIPPESTHSSSSAKKKDDPGEKKPKKKKSAASAESAIVSPRRSKGENEVVSPLSPRKPSSGHKKKTKSSSDHRRHTRKKDIPTTKSGGAAHSDWKMVVPDTLNPNHAENYKKKKRRKRHKDPNLPLSTPASTNNSDEELNDSIMDLSYYTMGSNRSLRDESDNQDPSVYTPDMSARSLHYDVDDDEDHNKPSSGNTAVSTAKEGGDDDHDGGTHPPKSVEDDGGGSRPTRSPKDKKSRAFLKSLGFGAKGSKKRSKKSSHKHRNDPRPASPQLLKADLEPLSAPVSPGSTQAAVKNAPIDNNSKRKKRLIDAANHISTTSLYIEDPSSMLLKDIKKKTQSRDDQITDKISDTDIGEDDMAKLKKEAVKARMENSKVREKLDWALAEVEKLTKERKTEKKQLKKTANQLDQVRTNYTKAMREVAQQEEIIMEKDMRILALEETRQQDGGDTDNKKSGDAKGPQSEPKNAESADEEESEKLPPKDAASGVAEQKSRDGFFSPMQKIRSMEQAMQKQVEAKDQRIEELELELEVLKRSKERAEPSTKPVEDLVEENKYLRQELVSLLDMQREFLALKATTQRASGKIDDDSVNEKKKADAKIDGSGVDDKINAADKCDNDVEIDQAGLEALHRKLSADGISPTFDVPSNWNTDSFSVLSTGDDSYLDDLENQVANKLDEQEETLMEEAREMYKIALEEKGVKESREILLYIYNELREETKEERQKEYLQLASKLHEARKQIAEEKRRRKSEEEEEEKGETGSGGVLREVKTEFKRRKSINYNEMVREIRKANATRGDNELKKDLIETKKLLRARDKEIVDLKTRIKQKSSATPNLKEEIKNLEVEKTTITQKLKDELKEAIDKLNRKDETIAFMQTQFEQSNQNTESITRIVELEREVEKYKNIVSERDNDLAAVKVELDELREELERRPGAEKSYFKKKKENDGSDDDKTLGSAISDIFKWGGDKSNEPPQPLGSSLSSFSWTGDKVKEPPKLVVAGPPNGDDPMRSNMMGNFVKGYFRKGANSSPSLDQYLEDEVHPRSKLPREVCSTSLESMENSLASASENLQEMSKLEAPIRTDNGKIGKLVKNFLSDSVQDAGEQAPPTDLPEEATNENSGQAVSSAVENSKERTSPQLGAVDT